jgi:hypothetical protein
MCVHPDCTPCPEVEADRAEWGRDGSTMLASDMPYVMLVEGVRTVIEFAVQNKTSRSSVEQFEPRKGMC